MREQALTFARSLIVIAFCLAATACASPAVFAIDARDVVDASDASVFDTQDALLLDVLDAVDTDATEASNATDASDAPPADVVIDYGMCGMMVRACLCGCAMDATCQGGCINADDNCGACVYAAAMSCCAMEESAFSTCVDRHMCVDQACIDLNCGVEQAAFNSCFQRRQTSVPACTTQVQGCLGAMYPMVQCVMSP